MIANGYAGGRASISARSPYKRMDPCLVIPPPAGRKPHAVVKFLGGAFIGAVPEATYSHLMELLAKEGFLVVSVPYNVTFEHERAARTVYERFHACMDMLLASGIPDAGITPSDISCLPLYSVGHSNGALLQLLVGSYFSEKIPKSVTKALSLCCGRPMLLSRSITGQLQRLFHILSRSLSSMAIPWKMYLFLDTKASFGPIVSQVMPLMEASPMYSMARNASGDAWKALLDTAGTLIQDIDQEAMVSFSKFVDQLPSVMNQVTQGISEFKPTPSENREFFKKSYSVPHTLLVKFNIDAIDETDLLEDILRPRVESIGGTLEKVTLSGNHLTPCIQDLKWQVGYQYTPADALAQSLKSLSLNDTRVLARTVADWLKRLNPEGEDR